MKFAKLFSFIAFAAVAVLSLGFASAATIFLDNFNSGISPWTPSPGAGAWNIPTGQAYIEAGTNTNQVSATIDRVASTANFQTITLSYDRQLSGGFESGDQFNIWASYDGTAFIPLSLLNSTSVPTENSFTSQTAISINASANNNPNFKIRFECITDAAAEFCRVDNVKLEGTQISASSNLSLSVSGTQPFNLGQNATLTVANNGNTALSNIIISEITNPLLGVTFSQSQLSLNAGASASIQAILSSLNNIKFGLNTVRVQATAGSQVSTAQFDVRKTFCSAGESVQSNLTIEGLEITNDGEGDEDKWELLDEIEIEVEVENVNDDDDIDAVVELGLFDSSGDNVADDLIFTDASDGDDEEIEINIDEGDKETVTWTFLVPADFDAGNYRLAVKVYDDDVGESKSCRDTTPGLSGGFFEDIEVTEASDEGRFVVVNEIEIDSPVSCGQVVSGQATVFNIGDEDQDRVRIIIQNDALGIEEEVEITTDLDQGDEETIDFTFQVPITTENGNYGIEFITQYDYKNGVYREESEETFDTFIEVIGCSENLGSPGPGSLTNVQINAELDSAAQAGEELIVRATITNTGDEDATFSISARGYSEWAELIDISDATVDVDAGESKDITYTFRVNDDAVGSQTFDIQLASGGRVQVQEVEVNLEEGRKGLSFDFGNNSLLWIIGIVNVILIILIIVVAVRLANR